jgi:hypothetical protein
MSSRSFLGFFLSSATNLAGGICGVEKYQENSALAATQREMNGRLVDSTGQVLLEFPKGHRDYIPLQALVWK